MLAIENLNNSVEKSYVNLETKTGNFIMLLIEGI